MEEVELRLELRLEDQDLRLLKALVSNKTDANEFAQTYDDNLFFGDAKKFAKCILSYIKNYKELPTKRVILDHVKSNPEIYEQFQYIWNALDSIEYDDSEFKYDLEKIKNRFADIRFLSVKNILDTDIPQDQRIKLLDKELSDIKQIKSSKKNVYTRRTLKSYIPDFRRSYKEKQNNPELGRGILTNYSHIDYITDGMRGGELWIIAGESSSGKSMVLSNIGIQVWLQKNNIFTTNFTKGYNVIYFSLEQSYEMCARRILARLADVPMRAIRNGTLNKYQFEALSKAAEFIERYPFDFEIIDIPRGSTPEKIEQLYEESKINFEPDLIEVDYLGIMEDPEFDHLDDHLKLSKMAGKMHEFFRAINKPGATALQLNVVNPKSKAEPHENIGIHRIGRSKNTIDHADVCIQIEQRKDEETFSDLKYHFIKMREGERYSSHVLTKNFKNASLTDSDPPFLPKEEEYGVASKAEEMEDIREFMAKNNWGR